MIYLCLVVGIIITIYGFILSNKEDILDFDEILNNQDVSDLEFNNSLNNELDYDDDFKDIKNKLDYVIEKLENKDNDNIKEDVKEEKKPSDESKLSDDTNKLIKKINSLKEKDYTLDDIAKELNMGKGEVLFLQRLEKKSLN
ncbi:MAG: hypothetical protein FH753_03785 [Firmicutes bacterium]|nr:hypothetical protein [Bacillota bacterium]